MSKKLLLVEDDDAIRLALKIHLTQKGYDVTEAVNGEEGVNLALEQRPDIILMDLLMPVMGGQQAIKLIRQEPWGSGVPIVILTNLDDMGNINDAFKSHPQNYFVKVSTGFDTIDKAIETLLSA